MIVGLAFAAIEGIGSAQLFAIPQFVLGMLALAVANNARAAAPTDGARRTGPWIAAVGGTVGVLFAVALLLGVLAFLNVGVLLNAVGEIAWEIIAFFLILLITPIYWVVEQIVRFLLPNGLAGLPAAAAAAWTRCARSPPARWESGRCCATCCPGCVARPGTSG